MAAPEEIVSYRPDVATLEQSNAFLRALWAELRAGFDRPGWQFHPRRDGKAREVALGWIYLAPETYEVTIGYAERGVIDVIRFRAKPGCGPEQARRVGDALRRAASRVGSETPYCLIFELRLDGPFTFHHYSFARGSLWPGEPGRCLLIIETRGFDQDDATAQTLEVADDICRLLTAFTNVNVQLVETRLKAPVRAIAVEAASLEEFLRPRTERTERPVPVRRPAAAPNQSWSEPGWSDELPVVDGKVALSPGQVACIGECCIRVSDQARRLVQAARHFARALYLDRNVSDYEDVCSTLLMSALEAVGAGVAPAKICEGCGQQVHKISKRVRELAAKHSNKWVARVIKDHYDKRSAFLHVGKSRPSVLGTVVPLLDPADPSGCVRSSASPYELLDFTGHILRAECDLLFGSGPTKPAS